jgi:hypothetical protein
MVSRARTGSGARLGPGTGYQAAITAREICGPLFKSYTVISNLQYRLTEDNGMTRLKFTHRAMWQIPHDAQIERGWDDLMARIRSAAR